MSTIFYVDENGIQLGGFGDGAGPPSGSIEVPAPAFGKDTWDLDNSVWTLYVMPPEELEAQVQSNTDDLIQNDKKFRVLAELIFDTLKAGKTGNYSAFDGVVDKSTFRDHVVARFRALN